MKILEKLPKLIKKKPKIILSKNKKVAIIDNFIYEIKDFDVDLNDLLRIWAITKKKEKFIIHKNKTINRIKIIDNSILICNCLEFEQHNNCIHIKKLKKMFSFPNNQVFPNIDM